MTSSWGGRIFFCTSGRFWLISGSLPWDRLLASRVVQQEEVTHNAFPWRSIYAVRCFMSLCRFGSLSIRLDFRSGVSKLIMPHVPCYCCTVISTHAHWRTSIFTWLEIYMPSLQLTIYLLRQLTRDTTMSTLTVGAFCWQDWQGALIKCTVCICAVGWFVICVLSGSRKS